MLLSGLMILFSLKLSHTMGMRGFIVQFGGALVVIVERYVVIARRHLECHHLARLTAGLLCQFVGLIRIFHRAIGVPVLRLGGVAGVSLCTRRANHGTAIGGGRLGG